MNCSVAKKLVKRVRYSLKSHGKTLLEVSGGGENEEETSVRKIEKGVREERSPHVSSSTPTTPYLSLDQHTLIITFKMMHTYVMLV